MLSVHVSRSRSVHNLISPKMILVVHSYQNSYQSLKFLVVYLHLSILLLFSSCKLFMPFYLGQNTLEKWVHPWTELNCQSERRTDN